MSYQILNDKIVIENSFFNAQATLFSGQVFKVKTIDENKFFVVSKDKPCFVEIEKEHTEILTEDCAYFENFFDLKTDYSRITSQNEVAKRAIEKSRGLKIMRQDKFETIIDFIMSANNNIKRFSKTLFAISEKYGEKKKFLTEDFYAFPSAENLANAKIDDLKSLGLGYRDKYVKATAQSIYEGFDLNAPIKMDTISANKKLCELLGIGEKVADCILLFAYQKYDTFPVDTWIEKLYYEDFSKVPLNRNQIRTYFIDLFKQDAGIIQQYLFHYKRFEQK